MSVPVGRGATGQTGSPRTQERAAAASGLLGNAIEHFEFAIYGLAATVVFPKVFFAGLSESTGIVVSLATFAGAYMSRPIGAAVFGHFGDRMGRRKMLIISLAMMGVSTALIGVLPTGAQVGALAAVLLILLRLIQGVSLGGEFGGAILMAIEHARPSRRNFVGALSISGLGWGFAIANLMFLGLRSALTDDQFIAWGWRIPFLFSALLVGVCLYIRVRLHETPEFTAAGEVGGVRKFPILEILRSVHGVRVLGIVLLIAGAGALWNVANVFSVSYGQQVGLDVDSILIAIVLGNVMLIVGDPLAGWIADRTGRRRSIFLGAYAVTVATPWVLFPLLNTGSTAATILGFVIVWLPYSAFHALFPTIMTYALPPTLRYTGVSLGYQGGSLLGSATGPLVAAALFAGTGSWQAVALYLSLFMVVGLVAAFFTRQPFELVTRRAPEPSGAIVFVAGSDEPTRE